MHVEFPQQSLDAVLRRLDAEKNREAGLLTALKSAEEELAAAKTELKSAERERKRAERRYRALEESRSWRYTACLRATFRLLRAVRAYFPSGVMQGRATFSPRRTGRTETFADRSGLSGAGSDSANVTVAVNDYVLYRIIGNDLFPRHKIGQSRENLRFLLENEPDLESCEKRWVVNRIIHAQEEAAILDLLREFNQPFIHIPFIEEEYKRIGWNTACFPGAGYLTGVEKMGAERFNRAIEATYRFKNIYVMNNNGARNAALEDGRSRAKWVLPWDGNCFLSRSAWAQIRRDIEAAPHLKYFAVPMARVTDNRLLLQEDYSPDPVEEPQLVFRKDAAEAFNENFNYGRRPKVELFWRLGIPGKWDEWQDELWDAERRPPAEEYGRFGYAGWVARLFSGMESLEQASAQSLKQRGQARQEAVIATLRQIDARLAAPAATKYMLGTYRINILEEERALYRSGESSPLKRQIELLVEEAEEALGRPLYSVVDKEELGPSGNPHDYYHPAPYLWPNPKTPDGLPYVRRDGKRVPGTQLYEPESDKYDRTRLQRVFDDSITLALAFRFTDEHEYAERGARILERFFLEPSTAMTPHLKYAQVRRGHNKDIGPGSGIIEMKDLYYYLDAVRLLAASGAVPEGLLKLFKNWLSDYLDWLIESPQGRKECKAVNNHGTYYDLQVAAIASFLNDRATVYETLVRAESRIAYQFAADGSQPEELSRTDTAHYCCFNLQGWVNLAELGLRWGADLWTYQGKGGIGLARGAEWLLAHAGSKWPYPQEDYFDVERYCPIWFSVPEEVAARFGNPVFPVHRHEAKARFYPHSGIKPYWNLG